MAPRKSSKRAKPPRDPSPRDEGKDAAARNLERAETPRFRRAAMLQLKMGRSSHSLSIISGLALATSAVLAYLLENWPTLSGAPDLLKWIAPLVASIAVSLIALALKWEPYFADRREAHFIMSAVAVAVPVALMVLVVLDETGHIVLGQPDWLYPASLLGISLTMISLAMTWEGRGRRKVISIASAAFPPVLMVFPMLFKFTPLELASILPMAYLGSAVAIQLSGSMLHIISSSTSVQEREVLKASDGKLREIIMDLDRKKQALGYREDALRSKESDLETYERRLSDEIALIEDRKTQVSQTESELEQRALHAKSVRQELTKKEVELEGKLDTMRLKQADLDAQRKELERRAKSLTSREDKLSRREIDADKLALEIEARERGLKDVRSEVDLDGASVDAKRRELQALQDSLAEREKQISIRESAIDLKGLEFVGAKEELGSVAVEKESVKRLEKQLLMRQEAIAEREISLRNAEVEHNKKIERSQRLIERSDKQMNELVEKEARLLEREKGLAEREAKIKSSNQTMTLRAEELKRAREELEEMEQRYTQMSEEMRTRISESSDQSEELSKKMAVLDRREQNVKSLERRLKAQQDLINSKQRELTELEKSLRSAETEASLRHAELKSMERKLLESVDDVEVARAKVSSTAPSEHTKAIELRERRLQEKEREIRSRLYQKEKELEAREKALRTHLQKDIDDMEDAVESEYAEEKVKTGIERLDDLMLGGMPFSSNVLFVGPPFIGKETAMMLFVSEGLKKGVPVVLVTTSHPPVEVSRQIAPIMPTFLEFDQLGLVYWIDATGSQSDLGPPSSGSQVVRVSGPEDFDGISEALDGIVAGIERDGHPYYRLAYWSLSMSVSRTDEKRAYHFIQTIAAKLRQTKAVGVYAVERGMHTEQQLESIQHQMTGAVLFRTEKKKNQVSVHGVCDVQTRDWIDYRHTNKAIMIGAFSLERIR
jgi:KaiC/GvpD/RAD55 family RecA-like ATPase